MSQLSGSNPSSLRKPLSYVQYFDFDANRPIIESLPENASPDLAYTLGELVASTLAYSVNHPSKNIISAVETALGIPGPVLMPAFKMVGAWRRDEVRRLMTPTKTRKALSLLDLLTIACLGHFDVCRGTAKWARETGASSEEIWAFVCELEDAQQAEAKAA
jgi:hypothetical protein